MRPSWIAALALVAAGCGRVESGGPAERLWQIRRDRERLYREATLREALEAVPGAIRSLGEHPVTVLGLDDVDPTIRAQIQTDAERLWRRAVPGGSAFRIAILSYQSSIPAPDSTARWQGYSGVIHPEWIDGRTCVALVPRTVRWFSAERPGVARNWLEANLASCLHLARFGPPGRAMATWLEATRYRGIQSVDWLVRPAAPVTGDFWWYQQVLPDLQTGWGRAIVPFAAFLAGRAETIPPYQWGPGAVGCLAGRTEACAAIVGRAGPSRFEGAPIPGLITRASDWEDRLNPIGPTRWSSELIRRGGEARFRQLWSAPGDFESAFRASYGDDLATAVSRWATLEWRRSGGGPVTLGTTIGPDSAAVLIVWVVLILAIPMLGWRSRTIGS